MILAILQARVSSTRLPGKVLKEILGAPMLLRQIERVKRSITIDKLVLATSTDTSDNPLENLCSENGISCFRGSLNDVLDRFYKAALPYKPEHVVRLTGDCPLADPALIDRLTQYHLDGGFDYSSNCVEPTWPDGLDAEIFRFSCLEEAWREATLPSQREHVTPFIRQQEERYRIGSMKNTVDLSQLRWTVDEPEDFELVSHVYASLYPSNPAFTTADILDLVKKDIELKDINARYKRNEGYAVSLLKDVQFSADKELLHGNNN